MGIHIQTLKMIPSIKIVFMSACGLAGVFGDYVSSDHQLSYNYQPYDYNYNSSYYTSDTNSVSGTSLGSARTRRVFTTDNPLNLELTFDLTMPLTDINSKIEVSVPFSFDFPTSSSRKRVFSGRSLDSLGTESFRTTFYKNVENFVGRFSGADGQSCLLRAMCEVGSNPFHGDGILGDIMNFMLTANFVTEEEDDRFKTYLKAQSHGQLTGDCSSYHKDCPLSFFTLISDNEL